MMSRRLPLPKRLRGAQGGGKILRMPELVIILAAAAAHKIEGKFSTQLHAWAACIGSTPTEDLVRGWPLPILPSLYCLRGRVNRGQSIVLALRPCLTKPY